MTRSLDWSVYLLGVMWLAGCGSPQDGLQPSPVGDTLLTFDDGTEYLGSASGAQVARTPASSDPAGCIGAHHVFPVDWTGIDWESVFVDTEVGATSLVPPNRPWWFSDNERATAGSTDFSWGGTVSIATWTSTLIVLDLTDGNRCDNTGSCNPAQGQLRYEGAWFKENAGAGASSGWVDVASDREMCRWAE